MLKPTETAKIQNILCPTDLSGRSQRALGFATRLAEALNATLTACHCAPANWFTQEFRLPAEEMARIKELIKGEVVDCERESSKLTWRSVVIENSFDPSRDILELAREGDADLIVMKARPSVLSAFRFGSIVERIIEGSNCPILLLPSRFLTNRDPKVDTMQFRRVLFDYDFTESNDQLFRVANTLTRDYQAELHMLSVLEPFGYGLTEEAVVFSSRTSVQTIVRRRIDDVLRKEGKSVREVPTAVEWGHHAETVLGYAKAHEIDLICTTLDPPNFYFEKLYSSYLGSLLKSADCPMLVKQSMRTERPKNFPL
jgi:nucleotide-binding universal stress UspA family protein